MLLKLKARNRIRGVKSSPMLTGTRKAGPSIPILVGIREVKRAASRPNPSFRARIYTDRTVIVKMMLGKYR